MNLIVTLDPSVLSRLLIVDRDQPLPCCATVVIQDESGRVGFDLDASGDVLRAILGRPLAIEVRDRPRWAVLDEQSIDIRALSAIGSEVVACSAPEPALIEGLTVLLTNASAAKTNEMFARHGRPLAPLKPTLWDHWVDEQKRVRLSALRWMAEHCKAVSHWSPVDGWYTARIFGWSEQEVLAPVLEAQARTRVRVTRVEHEADLPTW